MRIQTDYIDKELYYFHSNEDWRSHMPEDNWCLILISNTGNEGLLNEIIDESISRNVGYICGIGNKHEYIHDQADEEFVIRDIGESENPKPKYHIITVSDKELDEGLWFGLNLTFNEEVEIRIIYIIDTDDTWREEIVNLIGRFKEGFLPNEKPTDNRVR